MKIIYLLFALCHLNLSEKIVSMNAARNLRVRVGFRRDMVYGMRMNCKHDANGVYNFDTRRYDTLQRRTYTANITFNGMTIKIKTADDEDCEIQNGPCVIDTSTYNNGGSYYYDTCENSLIGHRICEYETFPCRYSITIYNYEKCDDT